LNRFNFHTGKLFFRLFLVIIMASIANQPLSAQNLITPEIITNLSEDVNETSGLTNLNGEIWTHNDKGDDAVIYRLKVYAEIIHYTYSDQTSWEPNHNNNDFDCEALISYGEKLYLFSKNWVDHQTRCYQLSKQAGTHIAEYQSTFDIECMVTGAEILDASNSLVLIGYNSSGGSYTWIFKDFIGTDFFDGNNTKLIWTSLTQIEGVCTASENSIYISSEEFSGIVDPTLYYLDVSSYTTEIIEKSYQDFRIFSNNNLIFIEPEFEETITAEIQLINTCGTTIFQQQCKNAINFQIPISVSKGIYIIVIKSEMGTNSFKIAL